MSGWWDYYEKEGIIPISIDDVVVGKEYFYLPGPGLQTGKVKVLSKDPEKGIVVEYIKPENGLNRKDDIPFNHEEKKLYELLSGGKKSSGNRKNKRTKTRKAKRRRKNKRNTNRRR
jgi:hypothetical protein